LSSHLPAISQALLDAGVTLKVDLESFRTLHHLYPLQVSESRIQKATEEDFSTEFLDLTIAVKVVPSISDAISHINLTG
jgi:glutamate-5-semialdehyde dehydrogenase